MTDVMDEPIAVTIREGGEEIATVMLAPGRVGLGDAIVLIRPDGTGKVLGNVVSLTCSFKRPLIWSAVLELP